MMIIRSAKYVTVALLASACAAESSTDPYFGSQQDNLGGSTTTLPGPTSPTAEAGAAGVPAGGAPATNPGAGGGPSTVPTSNPPPTGAGGQQNPPPPTMGGAPPVGAGGTPPVVASGSGGAMLPPPGSGGSMGAAGAPPMGNSGKCTFTFAVTTVTARGFYGPANVGAIWITDSSNKFVKTLQAWGTIRLPNAAAWEQASGGNSLTGGGNVVDAVTSATRRGHGMLNATWNCTDVSKNAVADGNYTVNVMFTENDSSPFFGAGPQASVKFTKSAAGADVTAPDTMNFTSMHAKLTIP